MSSIDERVVNMKFNNGQFQKGVSQTTSALDKLKQGLNLGGSAKSLNDLNEAGKSFSLAGLSNGVENISSKFSALGVMGVTALANITNKAVTAGASLIKSLTLDPIMSGYAEYETKLNSIQTILANTSSKGTNLSQVNTALAELNTYADKTIYSFEEMTRNIGTFTAAGVDLNTSVSAIKGIANVAAISGSNSQQASTAMYQLSQALATGTVKLMDWNSVVNAGMGGEVFQNAIKDTARVHGVAIDDIIKKNGSFRDSLQEGWLTSEILTETLKKFTGELSNEQLKSMGYTDEQIKGIQEMAKQAVDAATKVKSMSQLMGTLREAAQSGWATTWEIISGDFEQAKVLFTNVSNVIGGMIQNSADARNNMLKVWKDLGGRDKIITAIGNAFSGAMKIVTVFKQAVSEIFPPMTGQKLAEISEGIKNFSTSLIPSEKTLSNLKDTFKGFFSILHIGVSLFSSLLKGISPLFSGLSAGSGGLLEITATIGRFITKIDKAVESTKVFTKIGNALAFVFGTIVHYSGLALKGIGNFFGGMAASVAGVSTFNQVLPAIGKGFEKIGDLAAEAAKTVSEAFKKFAPALSSFGNAISEAFGNIATGFSNFMKNLTFEDILKVIQGGLIVGILGQIKKFVSGLASITDNGGGMLSSIKDLIGGVTETFSALQTQLKAGALLKIAAAIGLLALSLIVLSSIPEDKLASSLGAITVLFGNLIATLLVFEKTMTPESMAKVSVLAANMILLAIAVDILASAVKKLSNISWPDMIKGLAGLILILRELSMFMNATDLSGVASMKGAGMIIFATSLVILAQAVKSFGSIPVSGLAKGLVTIRLILGEVSVFQKLAKNSEGLISTAAGMTILGVALNIFAMAIGKIGSLSMSEIGKGLLGIAASLAIVAGAMHIMPDDMIIKAAALTIVSASLLLIGDAISQIGSLDMMTLAKGIIALALSLAIIAGAMQIMPLDMIVKAAALTIVAGSLLLIGDALAQIGGLDIETLVKGIIALALSLAIIAGAMALMTGAIPGALALLVVAAALAIFVPALAALGSLDTGTIVKGLIAMAAAFAIIGIAGYLITPVIIPIIALSAALALLGVACLATGVGVLALGIGLTLLAAAGAAGVAVLISAVTGLIGLIPMFLQQVAVGILAFALVIAQGGPAITAALTTVLLSLVTAITNTTPQIVGALLNMIVQLINKLSESVPQMVDSGLKMIQGILQGIADNIGGIVDAASNIITNFIDGIARRLPDIIQSGFNLILSFIRGLSEAVKNNSGPMADAGLDLAENLIKGMVNGIGKGVDRVMEAAKNLAQGAVNKVKEILHIASPSKVFIGIGGYVAEGFAIGMDRGQNRVNSSAEDLGVSAMDNLKAALRDMPDLSDLGDDFNPTITPVLDFSELKKGANEISGILDSPVKELSLAAAGAQKTQNLSSGGSSSQVNINFQQTNTSPTALSEVDIYRQTNNQLRAVKEALKRP